MTKGTKGYINRLKKRDILFVLVNVVIAAIIFLIGMLIWDKKENIATVIAVCSLLPGCKRIVNLIMIFSFKGISDEDYGIITKSLPEADNKKYYSDMLIASEKYFMLFYHVTLVGSKCIIYSCMSTEKNNFAEEYLNNGFRKRGIDMNVTVFSGVEDYIRALVDFPADEIEVSEDAVKYLESLLV